MPGVVKFWGPYAYRSAFHSTSEAEEGLRALAHLDDVLMVEGGHTVAAIIIETVVGTNGILVPPDGYLQGVRERCDRHGIVMICDEVMAGFGRCGEWFAFQKWGVQPDLVCFAKGVNSGYLPLGGVVISQRIADTFRDRVFPGGLTYSGHPLACASAVASINIFKEEGIIEHARMLGTDVIAPGLEKLQANHPSIGEVRGLGVFWALDLVTDRATRQPLVPYNSSGPDAKPMADLAAACKQRGLWPFTHFNRLHIVPPCTTTVDEMSRRPGNPRRRADGRRLVLHRLTRSQMWRKPGRTGAILYAPLSTPSAASTGAFEEAGVPESRPTTQDGRGVRTGGSEIALDGLGARRRSRCRCCAAAWRDRRGPSSTEPRRVGDRRPCRSRGDRPRGRLRTASAEWSSCDNRARANARPGSSRCASCTRMASSPTSATSTMRS